MYRFLEGKWYLICKGVILDLMVVKRKLHSSCVLVKYNIQ